MKLLTKGEILAADDNMTEDVEVPEWGGTVRVKGLSGKDRDRFETTIFKSGGKGKTDGDFSNMRARLVTLTVVNDKNVRIFSFDDAVKLGRKSALALDKVFAVAQRLSGLRKEDVDKIQKNLKEDPKDNSISD